jgi:hypothetical protein
MIRKSSRRRRGGDGEWGEAETEVVAVEGDLFVPFSDLSGRPCGSVGGEWERPIFLSCQSRRKVCFEVGLGDPLFIPKFLFEAIFIPSWSAGTHIFSSWCRPSFGNHERYYRLADDQANDA